ncbi:probable polygalacturonase At1g80170 isoform X2 [Rhododendron vialii]|uniref:probable polygalacturonase At1g80170 isoform X2 n=1 Tax=Rhododendron vialii TaxID=182163 RepID=UPI00265EF1F8|nr:probable polygalacturonase At1g80170 isoform X2 [Rhododendron vialii]
MGELSSSSAFSRSTLTRIIIVYSIYFFYNLQLNSAHVEGFDSLLRLPHSGASRSRPRSKRVFYVNDFGAKGDGVNDDTEISGTIIAPEDPDAWAGLNPQKWLEFQRVNHLTVEGGGIIEGMGQEWWARSCKINTTNPCHHAPTALIFHRCKNLKVRNLMVLNSQQMHMAFTSCDRVVASHLRVLAPGSSPNTDGIHISASTRVQIKNSVIGTGDDCISIVGNSSGIQIRSITCGPGHGISIGSLGKWNSSVQIHDVVVDGAFLSNTENGVRIKTWQGGSGFATNIAFQNVWMENVSNPIIIDQYYCDSPVTCQNQSLAVKVEDISFVGIKGTSATEEAIKFACSETFPCERLYLEDIQLVSYSGDSTRSFCWEAQGSCSGLVYPPPCFSYNDSSYIEQKVLSSSVLWSI